MNQELQDKLFNAFPKLFKQKDFPKEESAMCWGIECPGVWFDVIYKACQLIQSKIDNNQHLSDKYPQIEFTQVKEKFGALCMYYAPITDWVDGVLDMADAMVHNEKFVMRQFNDN
jgi:hypothetical protein